jgi:malonyl-CoA O-methyltransferase
MLGGVPPERVHRPAVELRASLSPEDAAALNGDVIDPRLTLPKATSGDAPLVVEGAGGVLVPVTPDMLTVGLIAQFGLPVVLVARSTLGTINHTLLSLEALRRRGIRVAGVILNGPASPGNRSAIERHGKVRVLAEIPPQQQVDASTVERLAKMMPAFETLEKEGQGAALDPEGDGRPLHP